MSKLSKNYFLLNSQNIPPKKSEFVLINFQEMYEKANRIRDGIDCLIFNTNKILQFNVP